MRIAAAAAAATVVVVVVGGPGMNTKSHGEDGKMPSQQVEVWMEGVGGIPVRDVSDT